MFKNKALHGALEQRLKMFRDAYLERPPPNRFEFFLSMGAEAYPILIQSLEATKVELRIDALLAIGKLFSSVGPTRSSLDAVVDHVRVLREPGIGPERQACFFAIGCSRNESLMQAYMNMLCSENLNFVVSATYVLGYARWQPSMPRLRELLHHTNALVITPAIWAVGQTAQGDDIPALVEEMSPMLKKADYAGWVLSAFAQFNHPSTLEPMRTLLNSDNPELRFMAVASIRTTLGNHRESLKDFGWLIPALQGLLKDEHPGTSTFALLSLAEMGLKLEETDVARILRLPMQPKSHLAN